MCRVMSSNQLRVEKAGQQPVLEFRKVLLTRCQKEFEKDKSNEEKLQKLRDDLEAAPEVSKYVVGQWSLISEQVMEFLGGWGV